MANIKTFSKKRDGNTSLSKNFKVKEFSCNDGTDKILVDIEMIPILQKIRDLGGSVTINSAYRTVAHNKKQGGASNSYHLYGRAFDIKCSKLSLDNICRIANTLGVKGIIRYSSFVHIDSRTSKYHATSSGARLVFSKYNIPFVSTVKSGSNGTETGIVQFKLNSLGYNCGTVDCDCGSKTVNAIKQFQKAKGLTVDGIVGKNTFSKLFQ